jgi:hypothetical protein
VRKLSFLFLCFFASFLPAQEASQSEIILKGVEAHKFISGAEVVRLYPYTQIPAFVKFRGFSGISEEQGELWLSKFAKFDQNGGLKLVRKESDDWDSHIIVYYNFTKVMKFLEPPIYLHFKNGFLVSANGLLYDNVSIQDGMLDEKKCLDLALKFINADVYKWQLPEEEANARYEFEVEKIRKSPTYYPKGELKIIPENGRFSNIEPCI